MSEFGANVARNPSALKSTVSGLAARLTYYTLVFRFDPDFVSAHPQAGNPNDEWHTADPDTTARFFSAERDARLKSRFLGFLRSGSFGLFLIREGQWAAYGWCSTPERSHPPHMPSSAAHLGAHWFFYFHTRQDLRGQGILKRLIPRVLQFVSSHHSHPLVLADTLPDNIPTQRALLSTGFFPNGVYTIRRITVPRLGAFPLSGSWNPRTPHPAHL
jgi:GNAT superfamily N-acetyltransferase